MWPIGSPTNLQFLTSFDTKLLDSLWILSSLFFVSLGAQELQGPFQVLPFILPDYPTSSISVQVDAEVHDVSLSSLSPPLHPACFMGDDLGASLL